MADRKTYHVVPRGKEGWAVEAEGAKRATQVVDTQAEAIAKATSLAKSQPLGQVKIHGTDNKIREEHTYGKDPFPPEG